MGRESREKHPLKVKEIPIPPGAHHPEVPHPEILPGHEFTACLIAPKGSGKTTLIANMLDFYQGYFHQIIVFSPTLYADEKWEYVRKRPLRKENKKLKRFLKKAEEEGGNQVVGPASGVVVRKKDDEAFDPKIPEDCLIARYEDDLLTEILDEQDAMVKFLRKKGETKHLADRILFIFDDQVGSSLFTGHRENAFTRLNVKHRHFSASVLMVSQAYKEVTRTVRINVTCLMTFEIPNEQEVRVVYEEHPCGMDRDTWLRVYHYCTEGEYNFMYINYKRKEKHRRVMRNFDQVVFMGRELEEGEAVETGKKKKRRCQNEAENELHTADVRTTASSAPRRRKRGDAYK